MRRAVLSLLVVLLVPGTAVAHSYSDPALRSVLDEVRPGLPPGVEIALLPSVVDELVLTNRTTVPLEVLGRDGRPFLRVRHFLVEANLANPDWYLTALPEGAPVLPASAHAGAAPRWAVVGHDGTWSEFDPRAHPPVTVTPELRAAGRSRIVAAWSIPLRYGGVPLAATGHVLLEPVRGGLVVATTSAPSGVTATPLQGELPGLFVGVPVGHDLVVLGSDGAPFLRFAGGVVRVRTASPSWRADQRARGRAVVDSGWATVARTPAYSWLEPRLRYERDVPPDNLVDRRSVVRRWSVPVVLDGARTTLQGTVTWVPRAEGLRAVRPDRAPQQRRWPWVAAGLVGACVALLVVRRVIRR